MIFAALIGRFFLHERLTAWHIGACFVVALGAILIRHDGGARRTASTVPDAAPGHPPR
jgi:drug/metabolite transporter (DMT)-like permease